MILARIKGQSLYLNKKRTTTKLYLGPRKSLSFNHKPISLCFHVLSIFLMVFHVDTKHYLIDFRRGPY